MVLASPAEAVAHTLEIPRDGDVDRFPVLGSYHLKKIITKNNFFFLFFFSLLPPTLVALCWEIVWWQRGVADSLLLLLQLYLT